MGSSAPRDALVVYVNYWEFQSQRLGWHLDELMRLGLRNICAFIPWQGLESDISHSLLRFLQEIASRKMTVTIIPTPEVGVHFNNSGLPRDLMARPENIARNEDIQPVMSILPPTIGPLLSLGSADFSKRYFAYLTKLDTLLADFHKQDGRLGAGVVSVFLTGSFWKYYRAPRTNVLKPFSGVCGDFSSSGSLQYRQFIENLYSDPEFSDPNPSAVNAWKTLDMDSVNRQLFSQQSELHFRNRSFLFFGKRSHFLNVRNVEMYCPEADPTLAYKEFLQIVSNSTGDINDLSICLDEFISRRSAYGNEFLPPYVHWTGFGALQKFSEQQRQYLILKSLLLAGAQGGGILLDSRHFIEFSAPFRGRLKAFSASMESGSLQSPVSAAYFTPHVWSAPNPIWTSLKSDVGLKAILVDQVELAIQNKFLKLLMVDPSVLITKKLVGQLFGLARGGCVISLCKSPLFTESAKREWSKLSDGVRHLDLNLGFPYKLFVVGQGSIVFHDRPSESPSERASFLKSLVSIAEIEPFSRCDDSRVSKYEFEWEEKNGERSIFLLNSSDKEHVVDLQFQEEIRASDFGRELDPRLEKPTLQSIESQKITLEVPPYGILPIKIEKSTARASREAREEAPLATQ